MAVTVTLVDPNGREWVAGSAIEVTDLLAQGYRVKGHGTAGPGAEPGPEQQQAAAVADPAPVTLTGQAQPARKDTA